MSGPDGLEERTADSDDRYERDLDQIELDEMLADEECGLLDQAERVMGRMTEETV